MASVDMAPRCATCSLRTGREVRHFTDTRHYGRFRRAVCRLLKRR